MWFASSFIVQVGIMYLVQGKLKCVCLLEIVYWNGSIRLLLCGFLCSDLMHLHFRIMCSEGDVIALGQA